ncbi:MAG: beta-exotoxin transport system ATP-binding protein [Actinomycetota bacterium]|nr:beta-exotoxin transport system ATP-binding protein [Actinomycetota bacterium]
MISVQGLSKSYGKHRALDGLDLEVKPGEVFGYLGPNGAGKTTTIRLLLDLIRPSSGHAEVLGLDAHADSLEIRRRVGYMPGELALYEKMTGAELLKFLGRLRGPKPPSRSKELSDAMGAQLDRPIGTLSKGNKQKIGLIQAMMHDPELLILDEPTSGLDPLVQHTVHGLLAQSKAEGRTVFLSSHALSEVEAIADRIAIIKDGSLAAVEDVQEMKARAVRRIEVRFARPVTKIAFEGLNGVDDVQITDVGATFSVTGSVDHLIKAISSFEVTGIVTHEPDLEEIFLHYYGDGA